MSVEPYYSDDLVTLYHGDCLELLAALPDCSVDAVITDPPYGLGFMGKAWDAEFISGTISARRQYDGDPSSRAGKNGGYRSAAVGAGRYDQSVAANRRYGEWCEQWAADCLRMLKPGGHLLAFGGTRTYHRIACAVEDVGFEVRDSIAWLYGSGFPKSLNLVDDAGERTGWGTALKPAHEPIVVARKSCAGTVAANVLEQGTGALNIDACRVARSHDDRTVYGRGHELPHANTTVSLGRFAKVTPYAPDDGGRWPTNVVLDDSQAAELDRQTGILTSGALDRSRITATNGEGWRFNGERTGTYAADSGGASRFFPTFHYEPKAPSVERPTANGVQHPTVKPLGLMRWLVRLVTPPGGTVLDLFAGSGTTAEACVIEGFKCIAAEREADYLPLIVARLTKPIQPDMFGASA